MYVTLMCLCAVNFICVSSLMLLFLVDRLLPCCNHYHGIASAYQANFAYVLNNGCVVLVCVLLASHELFH